MRSFAVSLVAISASLPGVLADVYLHNPRGSNNKLSETSNNAQNQQRLFDSENNANGGYQICDKCERVCDETPDDNNNQYSNNV